MEGRFFDLSTLALTFSSKKNIQDLVYLQKILILKFSDSFSVLSCPKPSELQLWTVAEILLV